jgi:hypothetical protein
MFVVAFGGAWLAQKSVVRCVLEVFFVFGVDPDLGQGLIDSAETWVELAFIKLLEKNNMPLCRERCWLESDAVDLLVQFVLGGVVSLLVVRSYGVMTVVAPF